MIVELVIATVIAAPCPTIPETGCYYPPPKNVIYTNNNDFTRLHETGHAIDYLRLVKGERHRIKCHPGFQYWPDGNRCRKRWDRELFANVSGECMHDDKRSDFTNATPRQFRNLCRLIERAATR